MNVIVIMVAVVAFIALATLLAIVLALPLLARIQQEMFAHTAPAPTE